MEEACSSMQPNLLHPACTKRSIASSMRTYVRARVKRTLVWPKAVLKKEAEKKENGENGFFGLSNGSFLFVLIRRGRQPAR